VVRPIRTFLDSGVLIAAFKGAPQLREIALQILEDPDRVFLTSPFVRLEMLPKAIFNKQVNETRFYEQFFARAEFVTDLTAIFNLGEKEAARSGGVDGFASHRCCPFAEGGRVHNDREADESQFTAPRLSKSSVCSADL
jgi:hypothetical protein